jgi:hypothetical protein
MGGESARLKEVKSVQTISPAAQRSVALPSADPRTTHGRSSII